MRLAERTLTLAYLMPRFKQEGALGGISEGFSQQKMPLRAAILPEESNLSVEERGAVHREKLRLLVPANAGAKTGDGVCIGENMYRICGVKRWAAHWELICEAI